MRLGIFLLLGLVTQNADAARVYTLLAADGTPYASRTRGTYGGHKRLKIYGRLDCPSALNWLSKGYYRKQRVFFATERDALGAGYNPCNTCLGGDVAFRDSPLGKGFVMRLARPEEGRDIHRLYNQFRDLFPFIRTPMILDSIQTEELLIVLPREEGDRVAGLIRWHQRRDGWATVYELAVHPSYHRLSIATSLMARIPRPRWLKCLTKNVGAMGFYQRLGMQRVGSETTQSGKQLTIWADRSKLKAPWKTLSPR